MEENVNGSEGIPVLKGLKQIIQRTNHPYIKVIKCTKTGKCLWYALSG